MNPWDSRFNTEQFIYGTEPNVFFAEYLKTLKTPGKLLLPAEGEGRNAVFAAKLGWDVDAFDSSSVARQKALQLAAANKVAINYCHYDINGFVPDPDKYDLVALIFFHIPEAIRFPFHRKLVQALKKGGAILIEAFAKEQINYASGGPRNPEMLFSTGILKNDFDGLNFQKLTHEKVTLDEGAHHSGLAEVVQMIAVKP